MQSGLFVSFPFTSAETGDDELISILSQILGTGCLAPLSGTFQCLMTISDRTDSFGVRSGHLLASLIHHSLRQTTSTTARPFTLPAWFPRHLLTTIDGKGREDTRLAEESEAGAKKREKGWVWVRGENGGEKGQTGL